MRQVLLVDDEAAVTNSLLHGIDWTSLGLTVSGVAMNGSQALEYIQKNPVDILITDIRMAELDGLSLSQQVYQMNRNIQIIIISGFAEFSYAQKALSYGVIGYVLKPIEYAELTRYLKQAVHKLDRDSGGESLLSALYRNQPGTIWPLLNELGLKAGSYYIGASISRKPLFDTDRRVLTLQTGYHRYGYISEAPFDQSMLAALQNDPNCGGFSYSHSPVPHQKLGSALKRLSSAAFQYFFDPTRKVFPDTRRSKHPPHIAEAAQYAEDQSPVRLIAALQKIAALPSNALNLNTAWNLYNIIASSERYGPIVDIDDVYSPEHLVFCFDTFQNMIETICARLEDSPVAQPCENLSNSAFLHMVKFAELHLSENCSLQLIAKEMNMNANYLGQLFKRETGKTYSAYVTELRIEKAKEMLVSGDLSINEIAVTLGFNDYFYFLKTFKRVSGYTPKQYRHYQKNSADI